MTDSHKLRAAIESSGMKYKAIAAQMRLSAFGLQKKIENVTEFKASEIGKLATILRLSSRQREEIFFAIDVEDKSTHRKQEAAL